MNALQRLFCVLRESPGWQQRHPTGPVHWDIKCERCGFEITDFRTLGTGVMKATRAGVTIAQRITDEVLCTTCSPLP
jgi:hypothetical protein